MVASVGDGVFATPGIEDGLGKDGDGGALDGAAGEKGRAGSAGDGLGAVDVAFGEVQSRAFRQRLDGATQEGRTGECAEEGIAERTAVADRGPLETAKGFLADLREQRPDGAQALEVEVAVKPAVTQEDFVAEDVGLHGEALGGVEGHAVHHVERGGIGIRPELVVPARMPPPPPRSPRPGLHRERIRPEPDLVDEPGEAVGEAG